MRDKCEFCLGAKGGVPGNENIIGGVIVCDYCDALLLRLCRPQETLNGVPLVWVPRLDTDLEHDARREEDQIQNLEEKHGDQSRLPGDHNAV